VSVTRGSLVQFIAQIVANAGFFAAVLMVARGLGPEGRGTIAFVIVSALILSRVADFGIDRATLVFASRRPELRPQLLANSLLFRLTAGVVIATTGVVAMLILGDSSPAGVGLTEVLLVIIGTLAVALTDAGDAFLVGSGRIGRRAAVLAIAPWVYAGLVGVMFFTETMTVTRAATAWATAMTAGAGLMIWLAVRVNGLARPGLALLRESIAFGVRSWVGSVASFLNMRFDQILLGVLATQAALGAYAVAVNGAEVLLYFPSAVATMLAPALARAEPNPRHVQVLRTFRILGATTLVTVVLAALVGPKLLPLVFGERFQDSVVPFLWLLPGALGYTTKMVFSTGLLASLSPGRSSLGSLSALATGVTLDLLLIPPYGATGAAIAASAAFVVGGLVAIVLYRRRHTFSWTRIVPRPSDLDVLRQLNPFRTRTASTPVNGADTRVAS
jgi:O-antigen/teichoic acid export membrane protein